MNNKKEIDKILKGKKQAVIYFHCDLDGVTSALNIKKILKSKKIKLLDAIPLQYGIKQYALEKPKRDKNIVNIIVDFSRGMRDIDIHTDHHNKQVSYKNTLNLFETSKSNANTLNEIYSIESFSKEEIEVINMVDSAGFKEYDIKPEDVMNPIYVKDKNKLKNTINLGLSVNKMLLIYKNKPDFLKNMIMNCDTNFKSMYDYELKWIKDNNQSIDKAIENNKKYIKIRKNNSIKFKKDILNNDNYSEIIQDIKNGDTHLVGNTVIQYGGGSMQTGSYDRYIPFVLFPNSDFLITIWPGLSFIQISFNPWIKTKKYDDIDLGSIAKSKFNMIMDIIEDTNNGDISLYAIKKFFEKEVYKINDIKEKDNCVGFFYEDLIELFNPPKEIANDKKVKEYLNMKNSKLVFSDTSILTEDEKKRAKIARNYLNSKFLKIKDMIMSLSGGHKRIVNLSGFDLLIATIMTSKSMVGGFRKYTQDDKEDYYEYVKNIKNDILKLISYEICKELNNLKPK